jgi:large subunit ribosomal protein L1
LAKFIGKRYKTRVAKVGAEAMSLEEAIQKIKEIKDAKFDETISLNLKLGIKPEQSDQLVRGAVSLPHGSGRDVRVICFCQGAGAKEAADAGAVEVGAEELVKKVQAGWLEFDAVVAHPDMMREVSKLGRVLGPRGLMPTPKTGAVTPDVGRAVRELKAGRVEFKNDKTAGVHVGCAKLSFEENAIKENILSVIKALRDLKPQTSKGEYLKQVHISLTHGPGVQILTSSL